jgi:hypothetical protein
VPFAPLRLLTVGLDGRPIKLVERSPTTSRTEYATLSYCWGSGPNLRTTKETPTRFREEIPSELIPNTFVDAIRITRSLGIPHIWIDALCIVQDDADEWQSEAAQMSEIYQGSQLTIAAAQSASSSQGCFPPPVHRHRDTDLFFRTRPGASDDCGSLVRVYRTDIRDRAAVESVISTRGWVLQEQLLSPRIVFCMEPDIHWQCQAGYQTQTGLSFDADRSLVDGGSPLLRSSLQLGGRIDHAAWQSVVEQYSIRQFTYSQDRIPAIAGIIRYLQSALDDDVSILGLWRKSFALDLAWLRLGGQWQISDITGLPSWTWFACQGNVKYNIRDRYEDRQSKMVENLELLDWDVQWCGRPYTSQVRLAQVRIKGPVREIQITPFAEGNAYRPPYFQVFGEDIRPSDKKIPWRCAGNFDDDYSGKAAAVHLCLLLFTEIDCSQPSRVRETFLILKPVEPHSGVRYRRVGLARIWGEHPTFDSNNTLSIVLV